MKQLRLNTLFDDMFYYDFTQIHTTDTNAVSIYAVFNLPAAHSYLEISPMAEKMGRRFRFTCVTTSLIHTTPIQKKFLLPTSHFTLHKRMFQRKRELGNPYDIILQ